MRNKEIHIVSHAVPWPVRHGGLVDLYYKIRTLYEEGILIHLHCFYKGNLQHAPELEQFCRSVHYYKRKILPKPGIPFIVSSRSSRLLLKRLTSDESPILLEGLHSTNDIDKLQKRVVIRSHNVEHIYYERLYQLEKGWKKIYYGREARLLKNYERRVAGRYPILTVSEDDRDFFKREFNANAEFVPVFIPWQSVSEVTGSGNFILYHGNLSVNENARAASEILETLSSHPLIIAGFEPPVWLREKALQYGAQIIVNPSDSELHALISGAHINLLPSLNTTGVKLKVLNALFNGRHCICNKAGISGSGLSSVCRVEEKNGWQTAVNELMQVPFTMDMIKEREKQLLTIYNNAVNAKKIIASLY